MVQKFKTHRPRPSAEQIGQKNAERALIDAGWQRIPKRGVATGRTGRGGACAHCESRRHGLPKAHGCRMYPVVWVNPSSGNSLCWKHAIVTLKWVWPRYKTSNDKLVESIGGKRR